MPPKLGIHSKGSDAVAASMHSILVERTGGPGQPTFSSAVMAFVDTSGVTEALGFPVGTVAADVSTGASLLMNLKRAEILHRPALGSNSSVLSQSRLRPQYTAQE